MTPFQPSLFSGLALLLPFMYCCFCPSIFSIIIAQEKSSRKQRKKCGNVAHPEEIFYGRCQVCLVLHLFIKVTKNFSNTLILRPLINISSQEVLNTSTNHAPKPTKIHILFPKPQNFHSSRPTAKQSVAVVQINVKFSSRIRRGIYLFHHWFVDQLILQGQSDNHLQYNYIMSHYNRRYAPLQAPNRESYERSLPFKNNEARLKLIYEGQQIFKEKNKDGVFKKSANKHYVALTSRKNEEPPIQQKHKSNGRELHLRQVKVSNRYKEMERDQRGESFNLPLSNQNQKFKLRNIKDPAPLTTRNKDDHTSVERSDLFKIKRKSISGSLRKKIKDAQAHHLSSVNPTIPLQLNYYEEGRRIYKEGKVSEALKLFEIAIQKNPELVDGYYYLALCHLSRHNYVKSSELLNLILEKFPTFDKKTVYLFAAISAKHTNNLEKALITITNGINKYPDYLDLYIYRAKLSEQQGEIANAQEDYQHVLKTKKDNPEVLFSYALILKKIGLTSNALSYLNSALYNDKTGELKQKILFERLKINFEANKLEESKKDILKLSELNSESSEIDYYKGLIHMMDKNKKQALLSFQKCIRINNNKESVAGALVEITKSKIQDRDFYSALYHINRSKFLQVSSSDIEKFKLFTEGVVFMMKRKINEGVENFYKLENQYSPIGPYFQRLFYLYRAFGHFMQNKHDLAISDYETSEKFSPKDKNIKYNQLIAEGIVLIHQEKFEKALEKFDQAQKTISQGCPTEKIEPYIYRAMTFIEKVKSTNKRQSTNADELETLEQIFKALKELDKAYDVNDSNSNMLYLRSLIYMYLGKSDDGLQDIIKAISKSQQNVAKYFFYRALAHETLNNKKQALNDFNICVNLDQKYANAYLERAKLLFSTDQSPKGLDDLKKMKELDPTADIKLHQCCLFYLYQEYDLAENCLEQIQDNEKKRRVEVLIDLKQLRVSNAKEKMTSSGDKMICDILLGHWSVEESSAEDLEYFSRVEYYHYLGIKYYQLGQYEQALNNFNLAIKEKSLQDLEENLANSQEQGEESEDREPPLESQTKSNELHYINFNIFLCYLAAKEWKKAYESFIRDILPAKEYFLRSQQVSFLSKLLFQAIKTKEEDPLPQEKQVVQIVLFRSLFGESIDYLDIQLPSHILRTKLCYLMPYARDIEKQYSAKIDPDFILSCLKINQVENRPEPPWVKRNNQDLVFTDEIIDINVEFQPTEHDEQNQEEYEGQGDEDEDDQEEDATEKEQEESKEEVVFDPRKFRDQMRLDDDIERKLQKIMQKKKQPQ